MIQIIQAIRVTHKGENIIVEPGSYPEVPKALKQDKDFLHYANSVYPENHPKAGKPNYIAGYKPTDAEKKEYKPLKKNVNKPGYKRIVPDSKKDDQKDSKDTKDKNKA